MSTKTKKQAQKKTSDKKVAAKIVAKKQPAEKPEKPEKQAEKPDEKNVKLPEVIHYVLATTPRTISRQELINASTNAVIMHWGPRLLDLIAMGLKVFNHADLKSVIDIHAGLPHVVPVADHAELSECIAHFVSKQYATDDKEGVFEPVSGEVIATDFYNCFESQWIGKKPVVLVK